MRKKPSDAQAQADVEKTINWAVTLLGTLAASWTLLAWINTTHELVPIPIFGNIGYTKTIVYSIPVIFSLVVCLYVVAFFHNCHTRAESRLERIPPAFTLPLKGPVAFLRLIVLLFFYLFPCLGLCWLVARALQMTLVNRDRDNLTLANGKLFEFAPDWWDGMAWRWHSDDAKNDWPSGYPGLEPVAFVGFSVLTFMALAAFLVFICLPLRKPERQKY